MTHGIVGELKKNGKRCPVSFFRTETLAQAHSQAWPIEDLSEGPKWTCACGGKSP
jgi:hypothetical protein